MKKSNAQRDADVRTLNLTALVEAVAAIVFVYKDKLEAALFERLKSVQALGAEAVELEKRTQLTVDTLEAQNKTVQKRLKTFLMRVKAMLIAFSGVTEKGLKAFPKGPVELATELATRLQELPVGATTAQELLQARDEAVASQAALDEAVAAHARAVESAKARLLRLRGLAMDARGSLLEVGISITLPKAAKPPSRTKKKGEGSEKTGNTKPKQKEVTEEKKVTTTEETPPPGTAENEETSTTETEEVAA
ncbi:MAG: hypothetical protein JNG84_04150 [Archangium sp.]|nr:hypothetical protein [Archangium sp.]